MDPDDLDPSEVRRWLEPQVSEAGRVSCSIRRGDRTWSLDVTGRSGAADDRDPGTGDRDHAAGDRGAGPDGACRYLTYSVTKPILAALALSLCAEERLDLELPVAAWYRDVPRGTEITLRHLLNHTSGLPDYGELDEYHEAVRESPSSPWSFEEFAEHTYRKGLAFPPGQGWLYSNPGYMLLKGFLERMTESSLAELVEERLAAPLALDETFVPEERGDLEGLVAAGSTRISTTDEPRDVRRHYHPGWVSHGVVASTTAELTRILQAVLSGELFGEALVEEMTTVVPVPTEEGRFRAPSYGLGLMADPEAPGPGGPLWGHIGSGPGYLALCFSVGEPPELGSTVALAAADADDVEPEGIVAALTKLLGGS